MYEAVDILWAFFQILIGYNLILPIILFFIYSTKRKRETLKTEVLPEADYAIVVTAYEQTDTLPGVVKSLQALHYSNYIIYIVADKCDISNLSFNDPKVILLRPEETLGSNTRSHFYAINNFIREHERITIIDSDNLVHPEYLNELNVYFEKGFNAVQGVRKARNTDTIYATLDSARDIYYHFFDGQVLFSIGSSATLAGSGMAFSVALYKKSLQHLDITGAGFDKVLQFQIVNKDLRIAFAHDAIVFDEKTSKTDQLVNQRARWINTWFKYFTYGFTLLKKGIINKSINQFVFGFILVRPPLFIFLLLSGLCLVVNIFVDPLIAIIWFLAFLLFILSFIIALRSSNAGKNIYVSLLKSPLFIFYQVLSLLKVKNANKHSVATKHYSSNDHQDKSLL